MSVEIYQSEWVLPISSSPIQNGLIAVEDGTIIYVGTDKAGEKELRLLEAERRNFGRAVILPGFVNVHTHLELTAMRGFLEDLPFREWILKLTAARQDRLSLDDLSASALLGTVEAIRAGITTIADTGDSNAPFNALRESGLRGMAYREVFGPDQRDAESALDQLKSTVINMRLLETDLVKVGVSPHAPYTVSGSLFSRVAEFALSESFDVCIHAAESTAEEDLVRFGVGDFAKGLSDRGIEWKAPGSSTIQYLDTLGVLETKPLLVHCVQASESDSRLLSTRDARVAHCPKSNAKLGHGVAPYNTLTRAGVRVGLGTDGVVSNNRCDMIDEARFCTLIHRAISSNFLQPSARQILKLATLDGARALGLDNLIGSLEVGKKADLVVLDLSGAHHNLSCGPEASIIFSAASADVILTAVDGRILFDQGDVKTIDEAEVLMRTRAASDKLVF
jgi:5-methylthioadenosine/S-adenosylhomocysteine deaminase